MPLGLSNLRPGLSQRGGGGAFDPATASWVYEEFRIEPEYLFQDAAGTSPVTASGQTVRRIDGTKGVLTLTATTGSIYTYTESGGVKYLAVVAGSAATDLLRATVNDSISQPMTFWTFGERGTGADLWGLSIAQPAETNFLQASWLQTTYKVGGWSRDDLDSPITILEQAATENTAYVWKFATKDSQNIVKLASGIEVAMVDSALYDPITGDILALGGASDSSPSYSVGRIYGGIIANTATTPAQDAAAASYGIGRTGGSPPVTGPQYGVSGQPNFGPIQRLDGKAIVPFSGKNGYQGIVTFNGSTQDRVYYMHNEGGSGDDHNILSLVKRSSDNKYVAACSPRNSDNFFLTVANNANDVSSFGVPYDISSDLGATAAGNRNYSYSHLYEVTEGGSPVLYLFFRAGIQGLNNWWRYFSKSTDGGATWSALSPLVKNGTGGDRPYLRGEKNGSTRIDFMCTNGLFSETVNNVYHFYMEEGVFYDTDGTELTLPIDLAAGDLTAIHSGSSGASPHEGSVTFTTAGHPMIVYPIFNGDNVVSSFRCATYNGTSWSDVKIYDANTTDRHVTACRDPLDQTVIFGQKEDAGGIIQIHKFTTSDGGATWADQGAVTDSDADLNYFQVATWAEEPRISAAKGTHSGNGAAPGNLEVVMLRSDGP